MINMPSRKKSHKIAVRKLKEVDDRFGTNYFDEYEEERHHSNNPNKHEVYPKDSEYSSFSTGCD